MSGAKASRSGKGLSDARIFEGCAHEFGASNVLWMNGSGPYQGGGPLVPSYMSDISSTIALLRRVVPETCFTFAEHPACSRAAIRGQDRVLAELSCNTSSVSEVFFWASVIAMTRHLQDGARPPEADDAVVATFKAASLARFADLKASWKAKAALVRSRSADDDG